MSRWEPHIDLMRLLEALGNEIVSMTEQDVREACAGEGWSMAMTARLRLSTWPELEVEGGVSIASTAAEVRELIDAVSCEPGDPEVDVDDGHIELRTSRHLRGIAELRSRTCHKQH